MPALPGLDAFLIFRSYQREEESKISCYLTSVTAESHPLRHIRLLLHRDTDRGKQTGPLSPYWCRTAGFHPSQNRIGIGESTQLPNSMAKIPWRMDSTTKSANNPNNWERSLAHSRCHIAHPSGSFFEELLSAAEPIAASSKLKCRLLQFSLQIIPDKG